MVFTKHVISRLVLVAVVVAGCAAATIATILLHYWVSCVEKVAINHWQVIITLLVEKLSFLLCQLQLLMFDFKKVIVIIIVPICRCRELFRVVPLSQIAKRSLVDGPQRISLGGSATSYFFQLKVLLLDALCLAECVNMILLLL